jgi:Bifunctional DNA primase/polymerase, N-terminal
MSRVKVRTEALAALARGWSVVPMGDQKFPCVAWKPYQSALPTQHQVSHWFCPASRFPNWGIIHGAVSGTVLLDFDNKASLGGLGQVLSDLFVELGVLPVTPTVETPSGGLHMLFRHPGKYVPTRKNLRPGFDCRGDGGFSAGAGSITSAGQYVWSDCDHPQSVPLADLPAAWLEVVTQPLPLRQTVVGGGTSSGGGNFGGIVTEDRPAPFGGSLRIVVDGRESHAVRVVWRIKKLLRHELGRLPTYAELHKAAWAEFRATTDIDRPMGWSFDARVKTILSKDQ